VRSLIPWASLSATSKRPLPWDFGCAMSSTRICTRTISLQAVSWPRRQGPSTLHASAEARFPFRAVEDGDDLPLGNVGARVLHVPGHTPEHLALVVTDRTRGPEPWFVLTGHTLMVGDMGRTELASSAEAGARALFRSAERLRALPEYMEVLPGAFAGSVCGRGLSGKPTSTIGFERRFNRAFALTDEQQFVQLMLQEIPPRPERAREIRAANLGLPLPVET
jgi:hydroxyacylglutathione hydrolase